MADERNRLLALGADLTTVWHSETTTPRDRKELLRALARFNSDAGESFMPMREAMKMLGVSRQTVLQRVKRGDLEAVHVMRGKQKGLRIKVIDLQSKLFNQGS